VDGTVAFLTIWDVVRNQWFYTGVTLADNVPGGILFMVASYCAVEIADVGNEGATYGLVTTVSNLATPFSTVVYKYLDSFYAVSQDDIKSDSDNVRRDVTTVYVISYAFKLLALSWLWLLPPQKAQLQNLKRHGRTSRVAGVLLVSLFLISLLFSIVSSLLAIYPSTKCFRLAGGTGDVGPDGLCNK
ncbi:hypothetical protein As57867_017750, partial [Aphanomyces stellatus]